VRSLSTERRDPGRSQARVLPPVTGGQNLLAWESATRNERDTARNMRRSGAHKGLQPVRHPNACLHDLWCERRAIDRVEHVADQRP
jgi:hypothetical protein